jgi:hypothetical protein
MNALSTVAASKDIGQRVLHLIENIRSPADIAPENLERTTGRKVEFDCEDPRIYGFGERLDERWVCNLLSLRDHERSGEPNRLLFSFDDQTGRNDDWSAVCGLDFEDYARALSAAGYVGEPLLGPRDAFHGFRFRRGPITVDVQVRGENAERPGHLCVARMLIDTAEVGHALA